MVGSPAGNLRRFSVCGTMVSGGLGLGPRNLKLLLSFLNRADPLTLMGFGFSLIMHFRK